MCQCWRCFFSPARITNCVISCAVCLHGGDADPLFCNGIMRRGFPDAAYISLAILIRSELFLLMRQR